MKYPIGILNFGEVRRNGYAYVDKTALLYKLVSEKENTQVVILVDEKLKL
ncbi:MAG: hypothetical protein E7101_08430 [Prevotella ruminicola]|jgi:hypothetical protein|uniref:AAA-ATPase-like domain-containing protein n=1 Tax=Xylanibacter ruminicola TaxID=839 RepID=A0A9D5SAG8_XYLRU|nr:hypothetical protein [Xylanibacter ruminicola]